MSIRTTKNFWSAVVLKVLGGRRRITFRNGFTAMLSWTDYFTARGLCEKGFFLETRGATVFCKKGDLTIAGTFPLLRPLTEDFEDLYDADCSDKTVLDIGGCVGETAVFFARRGANKVIVYEPVAENHRFIELNCSMNGVDAELHQEGVGAKEEVIPVRYDEIDAGLGIKSTGRNVMVFRIRNLEDVIERSGADIAKLDCEGGEEALAHVSTDTLRMIGLYMVEVHSPCVRDALIRKFAASGFEIIKDQLYCDGVGRRQYLAVLAFKRLDKVVTSMRRQPAIPQTGEDEGGRTGRS